MKINQKNFIIIAFICGYFNSKAQMPATETFRLIEVSIHINEPKEIIKELNPLKDTDSLMIITFSKATNNLLEQKKIIKKTALNELKKTGFKKQYFILLIGSKAVFYIKE